MEAASPIDTCIRALEQDSPSEAVAQSFPPFNSQIIGMWAFRAQLGKDSKRKLMELCLAAAKRNALSEAAFVHVITTLRIFCREKDDTEILADDEFVLFLAKSGKINEAAEVARPLEEECLKCLANLGMNQRAVVIRPLSNGALLAKLAKVRNSGALFALTRLCFFVSMEESRVAELREKNAQDRAVDILEYALHHSTWPATENIAVEALKLLFHITMHHGPLNGPQTPPNDAETASWKRLVPLLQEILSMPDSANWEQLKSGAMNCIINTPYVCTTLYQPDKMLPGLIRLLAMQLEKPDEAAPEHLMPVLLVLTSIARDIPIARRILKQVLFPVRPPVSTAANNPVETPKEVRESNSIGFKLIKHMHAINQALNYYCNEFIFQLCNEDAKEVISLTGFGPAAGLLYMRGLFGGAAAPPPRPVDPQRAQVLSEEVAATAARQEEALLQLESQVNSGALQFSQLSLDDATPHANGHK